MFLLRSTAPWGRTTANDARWHDGGDDDGSGIGNRQRVCPSRRPDFWGGRSCGALIQVARLVRSFDDCDYPLGLRLAGTHRLHAPVAYPHWHNLDAACPIPKVGGTNARDECCNGDDDRRGFQ